MKNKKIIYVLLLTVIIVWGIIIFKVLYTKNSIYKQESSKKHEVSNFTNLLTHYVFNSEIKDPFIKSKVIKVKQNQKIKPIEKKTKLTNTNINFDVSNIVYNGLIYNSTSNIKIAIVSINNKKYFIKEEHKFDDILFTSFSKDSIMVTKTGVKIFIKKQK